MTYVIGDVHGEYDTLVKLIDKLPTKAELIFVGDLCDRGFKTKEVIKLIREGGYQCVLGNHDHMMIHFGTNFTKIYPNTAYTHFLNSWFSNGGKNTLMSYNLIDIDKHDGKPYCIGNDELLQDFLDDIQWLKTLPLYIKIPNMEKNGKKIVVSHASMADVWHSKDSDQENFSEYALWNRTAPNINCDIFNIYGHTIVKEIDTSLHYINVDTGCYNTKEEGYARLSAYCIEQGKVISQRRVPHIKGL